MKKFLTSMTILFAVVVTVLFFVTRNSFSDSYEDNLPTIETIPQVKILPYTHAMLCTSKDGLYESLRKDDFEPYFSGLPFKPATPPPPGNLMFDEYVIWKYKGKIINPKFSSALTVRLQDIACLLLLFSDDN